MKTMTIITRQTKLVDVIKRRRRKSKSRVENNGEKTSELVSESLPKPEAELVRKIFEIDQNVSFFWYQDSTEVPHCT